MSSPALLEPSGLSSLDKAQPASPARRGSLAAVNFLLNALRDGFQGKRFLILLQTEAELVSEAARLLSGCAGRDLTANTLPQFLQLKSRAREVERSLTVALRGALIAPLAHEDIRVLSVTMIRILENIVEVARHPFKLPWPEEVALGEASDCCAKAVSSAIEALPNGKGMAAHTMEIAIRARKSELLLRDCEIKLDARERDPVRLLKRRQASRALRSLFRSYREISNTIENAVLKNG